MELTSNSWNENKRLLKPYKDVSYEESDEINNNSNNNADDDDDQWVFGYVEK